MMNKIKKMLAVFMAGAILITGSMLPQENVAAEDAADYGIRNPRVENGVTTWDKIKFGCYYQNAKVQPAEPIKWRVLSVDGDEAILLADKILDVKPYNEKKGLSVTWETCTLRKWLNEDFYNDAFDDEEKKAIGETTVVNEDNPESGIKGGNDTQDKVYLLSIAEASDAAYGFDTSKTREAKNTDYLKVNNVPNSPYDGTVGNGFWWLRSPGEHSDYASYVAISGYGNYSGAYVDISDIGVRPTLHINLSSSKVKDAGRIDSKGNITMSGDVISNPVIKDGVTTWDCVYFGNYRQNCIFEKQAIEWRVLSVDGDDAFLLADGILDTKPYNEKNENVTWETCSLRKWLNEDFYNDAFNDEEKKAVIETAVVNDDNRGYRTEGGNDTKDKVYLLSIEEAYNAVYGFDSDSITITREAKITDYLKVNNVRNSTYDDTVGNGYWWLRSPGANSTYVTYVNLDGCGRYDGHRVDDSSYGVRPVLHISLSAWNKAGQIGSGDETPLSAGKQKSPSAFKKLKLSSVKCVKNTKKINGKVSVSKASVKIKVGKRAYKKASVKGKKFTLTLNYKLKKKTKITVKVEKKGYKRLIKTYTVK